MHSENWKTSFHVIPAQPGWNIIWPDVDYTKAGRDPIIGWTVRVDVFTQDNDHTAQSVDPIIVGSIGPHDDCYIESPDGQIHKCEDSSWDSATEWLESLKKEKISDANSRQLRPDRNTDAMVAGD